MKLDSNLSYLFVHKTNDGTLSDFVKENDCVAIVSLEIVDWG